MALLIVSIGWGVLLGLAMARFWIPNSQILFVGLLCVVLVLPVAVLASWRRLVITTALGFGVIFCFMILWDTQTTNQYQAGFGQTINTTGYVVARPSITSSGNQALIVRPDGFTQDLRVSLYHHTVAQQGERVWIRGILKQPENFDNFNYVAYLRKHNITAELSKPRIIILQNPPHNLSGWLGKLRQQVIAISHRTLNEHSSAIVLGMLIGHKEQLPAEVEDSFRKSGLIHILVVSGFNLTIIALGVGVFAKLAGRRLIDVLALVLIWLFVILVGATAAVIRAAVMASIIILARFSGRLAVSAASLLLAVVIMSALNPWQLFYDIGFQLSVAATFGVLEASRLRVRLGAEGWLSELLWPSLGAILCTAPIIAHYFGTLSTVAPLANLLVLPLVPYLMLFGALALLPITNYVFAPLTEMLVAWEMRTITTLASWPYSQLEVVIHPSVIVAYYFIIVMIVWLVNYRPVELKKSILHDKITKISL